MLEQIWHAFASWATLDSGIRYATPLIFAAMAGVLSERSGIVDIGLEGKMLASAFAAAAAAAVSGSAFIGLFAAIATAVVLSMVHGIATIIYNGDHIISGLAINFFASGMTITLGHAWFKQGGQTPSLGDNQRFTPIELPFAQELKANVPVFGDFYADVLSGHSALVYLAFVVVFIVAFILYRTTFGLRLRAVGEEPGAVDSAGISVRKMRFKALILVGILSGLGGAYFSMSQNAHFGREMTAGAGYIALAAVITGKWQPFGTFLACLLFGVLTALEGRMSVVEGVPTQVFTALPYLITVILLAGFIGKSIPPKAVGKPYVKER
ncbi:MAG: sugar ABC transporter permease [Gammaproteobacteria bacterium]|nr:MAG: sugar ABC transporter permease [Gammaproteobacteria bacterium]